MGQDRIKEVLAWAAGSRRGRAPVTAKAGDYLRTRYTDDEDEVMAQEDGEVGLLGPAGGPGTVFSTASRLYGNHLSPVR